MREIKCRGKRVANGEWVCGYYIQGFTGISYIFVLYDHILNMVSRYEVDPETVGQYTGLKDKNGIEIYEGDIVENTTQTVYLGDKFEVVWNKNYAGYQLTSNGLTSNIPLTQDFMSYEVIGDIYENSELMEDG